MFIESIDTAVRKAIADAGDVFHGHDIEKLVAEACTAGAERISLNLPVTLTTADEPWLYVSSALTYDRKFEIYVMLDLSRVSEDYLKAKVYRGVFAASRPQPSTPLYEKSLIIKAEEYEAYIGKEAVENFAMHIVESGACRDKSIRDSVHESLKIFVPVLSDSVSLDYDLVTEMPTSVSKTSALTSPKHARHFSLNSPPGIVEMILSGKEDQASGRFNESIDRQLVWEVDGDLDEMEAIKAVSRGFGGILARPGGIIIRHGYNKSSFIAEGKSYALAHIKNAIATAEVSNLAIKNPLWGSW